MIDSVIWKEKLEQDVHILKKRLNQRHRTERSVVLFERELMLTFFSVRALIEAGKLTDRTSHKEYKFITYPNKSKIVDDYTKYGIDDVFDLHSGTEKNLSLKLLTHQFVHAYVIFTGACAARFAVRRFPGWKLVPPKWRCLTHQRITQTVWPHS